VQKMRPRPARPLLADCARPRAIALLAGCVILVAVLGTVFARQSTADAFDRAVDSPVIAWFAHRQNSAGWLSLAGTPIPAAGLTAVIVAACLLAGRLNGAVLAAAAVPVATVLNETLIKPLVHRTYLGQVVYPSGHAATIFALAATVTVLVLGAPRRLRVPILTVTYAVAVAVVAGVIGLRYHYFTDTVAGAAVGTGTVCGLALILDLIYTARSAIPKTAPVRSKAAS
jgi:membrane-associated phospholipid phosphatase